MAAKNTITTLFKFDSDSGLKKVRADVAATEGALNKAKTGVKGLWAEFKNNRAAQAAVAGIAVALGKQAVDAASDLQESINAVNVTYGENADAVIKLGEQSAESFGMSQRAFNEFAVQFSAFADQVANRDGRAVVDVVNEMTTRVADFASVMNLDVSEAARIFQSALSGEQEPIKRFGVNLSAAAVEMFALRKGLITTKSELTENIKVQARYGLLMEETAKTSGDFKNTQDSLANASRTLGGRVEDLAAKLGQTLIPAAERAVGLMSDIADETEGAAEAAEKVPGGWEAAKKAFDLTNPLRYINAYNEGVVDLGRFLGIVGDEAKKPTELIREMTAAINENADALVIGAADALLARRRSLEYADALKDNAREATYNADAHDEMGRIQRVTNDIVDRARRAQERYMDSIKHTRDEVGHLRREIEDRQAWHALMDTFEATRETLADQNTTMRESAQATDDLRLEVLDYAESINLPDKVTTQLIALIDEGKLDEVEALLARWGNGITVPIKPQVINTGGGTGVRITPEGNVVPINTRARGGPVAAGQTYLVGEDGPELLHMGNQSGSITPNDKIGVGGGSITVNIMGGYVDDRTISELERRLDQWRKGVR